MLFKEFRWSDNKTREGWIKVHEKPSFVKAKPNNEVGHSGFQAQFCPKVQNEFREASYESHEKPKERPNVQQNTEPKHKPELKMNPSLQIQAEEVKSVGSTKLKHKAETSSSIFPPKATISPVFSEEHSVTKHKKRLAPELNRNNIYTRLLSTAKYNTKKCLDDSQSEDISSFSPISSSSDSDSCISIPK